MIVSPLSCLPRRDNWTFSARRWALLCAAMCSVEAFAARAQDAEMRFDSECGASVCFAIAEGRLDDGAPERFEAFIDAAEATYQVLLSSNGGSLEAGERLGRAIRARGLGTLVADRNWLSSATGAGSGADCLSACAYAFLGGTTRSVPEGNRIGFHQFALTAGARLPPGVRIEGLLSDSNQAAAELVSYIVEMDVDARLFALASEKAGGDMYFPGPSELEEYDVVTPAGFDHFRLEPYDKGIIAVSERMDSTGYRDLVTALFAYCSDSVPQLMLTAAGENGISEQMDMLGAGIRLQEAEFPVGRERIATWSEATGSGHIRFELTPEEAGLALQTSALEAYFDATGAEGGTYLAKVEMSDMDRKMLEAAFRLCI